MFLQHWCCVAHCFSWLNWKIVTGCNTGLGQAMALGLADAGCSVVGVNRSTPTETIEQMNEGGHKFLDVRADLASQEDVQQSTTEPIVKLKKHDFAYHVGGGFDFYLPYFKFGIEIKLTNGMKNLLIQDDTFFAAPLESLKSQTWWFSITFEG